MDRVSRKQLFPSVEGSITRGHSFWMRGRRLRGDLRKTFFTQWMVGIWNALPGKIVEAGNLETLKKYLEEHLKHHNIQGYGTSAGKWD